MSCNLPEGAYLLDAAGGRMGSNLRRSSMAVAGTFPRIGFKGVTLTMRKPAARQRLPRSLLN